jgi:hypothetical protein
MDDRQTTLTSAVVKQFYSQGYEGVYDEGQPLVILPKKWSFHIHGLNIEPADKLDPESIYPYQRILRFDFNLESIWNAPEESTHSTYLGDYFAVDEMPNWTIDESLRVSKSTIPSLADINKEDRDLPEILLSEEEKNALIPLSVWESYQFYDENVTQQDWGNVYGLRVTIEGKDTFIIRTTTDGSDGWLEVFDGEGNYLASARMDGSNIAWRSSAEIREYVSGDIRFPPELDFA